MMAKAQRIEDLQLIVAQTLERLQQVQRYRFDAPWSVGGSMGKIRKAPDGDLMDFDEMLDATADLRRAMSDSVFGEEGSDGRKP
jgi:hypothetical protein